MCGWLQVAMAKDIALVANKDNSVKGVAVAELIKICKGQTNRWPDGNLSLANSASGRSWPDMDTRGIAVARP